MNQKFTKFGCGLAVATLTFALAACDDSSSASANGSDNEEISSESNGSDGIDSSESTNPESSAESSAEGEGSSTSMDESSASLDDNSSSSMAVTCQALTLECYSATQLCNKGLTEYCVNSSASDNSSSSGEEICQHITDVDGGSCKDDERAIDCVTGDNVVCVNKKWIPAVIGDPCQTSGKEITVNEINLICTEDKYWNYKSTIDNCPPGSSCQRPNYSCSTHPINGFSCNSDNGKVQTLFVSIWSASDCMYYCQNGKYQVVMPPAPVGD